MLHELMIFGVFGCLSVAFNQGVRKMSKFKVNEATSTILASDLPEMSGSPTGQGEHLEGLLGVKLRYHLVRRTDDDGYFDAMTIEWTDGLRLFMEATVVDVLQAAMRVFGDSGAVLQALHDGFGRRTYAGVYRVVDTEKEH